MKINRKASTFIFSKSKWDERVEEQPGGFKAQTANQGVNRLNAITFPTYSCLRKGLGEEIRLYICCQGTEETK